ncbi:MAG: superoxide dismutase [Rhizomicrobium sp.]
MTGPFALAALPWGESDLEPVVSARTIGFHYHKHHQTYVDTLNKLVKGTVYADLPLEQIVQKTSNAREGSDDKKIFNNAGQVWNHDFYWRSLTPKPSQPAGALRHAIERDFTSVDALLEKLAAAGKEQFGSGWVWLVSKGGTLAVEKTANADDPMAKGINCLLTLDVWEHAYYLDYQNERPRYLETVLKKIVNWDFAAENLGKEDRAIRAAAE